MTKRTSQRSKKPRGAEASVVDLSHVRQKRRRELAERRVRAVLDENRAALRRLFATGLIFTQKGSRAGRALLLAHQGLLKIVDVFGRLDGAAADDHAVRTRAEEVFRSLDAQLARTIQLTARTGAFLAGQGRD